jgi:ABC-type sugar transport system ATPase subunit
VTVGIRPQNLSLAPVKEAASVNARVILNEYLGEQSIVTLEAGGASFRALAAPDLRISTGSPVSLYYRTGDVMVFDRRTEAFIG